MNAYQEFCKLLGGVGDEPGKFPLTCWPDGSETLAIGDDDVPMYESFVAWVQKYKRGCLVRWWEHKPIEEIESMLLDLPLRPEIYKDLIQLIGVLFVQVEDMELSEVPREFLVQVEEEIQVFIWVESCESSRASSS